MKNFKIQKFRELKLFLVFSILLCFSKLLYFSNLLDFPRFVFIWQICQILPKIPVKNSIVSSKAFPSQTEKNSQQYKWQHAQKHIEDSRNWSNFSNQRRNHETGSTPCRFVEFRFRFQLKRARLCEKWAHQYNLLKKFKNIYQRH